MLESVVSNDITAITPPYPYHSASLFIISQSVTVRVMLESVVSSDLSAITPPRLALLFIISQSVTVRVMLVFATSLEYILTTPPSHPAPLSVNVLLLVIVIEVSEFIPP